MVNEDDPSLDTPQFEALESHADVLFYGGSAGGGKTDLLIGAALTRHKRSVIFRRQAVNLVGVEQRVAEILGSTDRYNSQKRVWKLPEKRLLELGHCQHAGDENGWQGRAHDLKAFDEVPHFLESQFRFLAGWLRTTDDQQRCRVIAAGNPPTDSEGEWVIGFWAPWLDDQHPNPALSGELRWVAVVDGEDKERETNAPFEWKGELIVPKSRTFVPSRVEDNPYLMKTGYRSTLQALPEPLRSQMLRGDFLAGREDNPFQLVPTAWVEAAQERWRNGSRPKVPMSGVGVDPSRGGADETVIAKRFGSWFEELIVRPGSEACDGPTVAGWVVSELRDGAEACVDAIGIGSSVYDHLKQINVTARAMVASQTSDARDRTGTLGFVNKRAEWMWRFREALDPDYGSEVSLPPDPKLKSELCAPRWRLRTNGIQVESKDDIKKRIRRSTDRGDAVAYAWAAEEGRAFRRRGGGKPQTESGYDPHKW